MNISKPAKAMEEQILEILKKRMIYPDLQDRLKMTLTLMSEDITSHIMDFIEWLTWHDHPFTIEGDEEGNPIWSKHDDKFNRIGCFIGIEEVYQYWLNNVKHA